MDASIGRFSEISLKNMDNAKVVEDPESDNPDVVTIHAEERYNYETEEDEIHYYLEPKSKGTANITMSFKADGMTYSDTITVNVGTDDSICLLYTSLSSDSSIPYPSTSFQRVSSCKKVPSPQPTSSILSVSRTHIFLIISSRKASLIRNSFRMPCGLYGISLLLLIIPENGIFGKESTKD